MRKNPLYSGDPTDWDTLPLAERLEWIRKHLCTGPGAACSQAMTQRSRISETLKRANAIIVRVHTECPGHGRGGSGEKCCERSGEYNGFGSDGPER